MDSVIPLRRRLAYRQARDALLIGVVLGVLVGSGQLIAKLQHEHARAVATLDRIISVVRGPVTQAVYDLDRRLAAESLKGLLTYSVIRSARIVDDRGSVLAKVDRPPFDAAYEDVARLLYGAAARRSVALRPVAGEAALGRLEITLDNTALLGNVLADATVLLLGGVSWAVLLAALLSLLLHYSLTRPLLRTVGRLTRIRPGGGAPPALALPRGHEDDEIGLLVRSVRELVDRYAENLNARERAEAEHAESEARFRDVAEATADAIWELDADLRFRYVSDRMCELARRSREQMIGRKVREALGAGRARPSGAQTKVNLRNRRPFRDHRMCFEPEGGEVCWWSVSGKPVYTAAGVFIGYRGTVTDITEAQALSSRLSYQASHDSLTGLINRGTFEQRLERALETAREEGAEHALCYLDLDQFKVINDTCGHVAGDELLRQLGRTLQSRVRRRDTLARLGGDEFGVLLERCTIEQARRTATDLHRAVARFNFDWKGQRFRVGVSIGLAPVNARLADVGEALAAADSACYAAKEQGRNQIRVYLEDDKQLALRQGEMQWVPRIQEALDNDRFELHFQPIVPLGCGDEWHGLHHELLLRIRDPEGTLVSPGAFLPAAERYGLATTLDRWVVGTALDWLASGLIAMDDLELCAINLSGRSLGDEGFLEFVIERLRGAGVPAEKLCFEVTETAAIANLASATHFMHVLKALGCRFALDDFGSGLSSFAYLKTLPVDLLKIDGTFVREIATSRVDRAMVKSINELAHVMGKRTIAEFVENAEIRAVLVDLGVDYAQGYGIGRPRPLSEIAQGRGA